MHTHLHTNTYTWYSTVFIILYIAFCIEFIVYIQILMIMRKMMFVIASGIKLKEHHALGKLNGSRIWVEAVHVNIPYIYIYNLLEMGCFGSLPEPFLVNGWLCFKIVLNLFWFRNQPPLPQNSL